MRVRDLSLSLLMCIALAGCADGDGDGEIQGKNSTSTPRPPSMPPLAEADIPFYKCMEQQGLTLSYGEDGAPHIADKENPLLGEAEKACARFEPSRSPVQASPQELAAARRGAECMRAEGVTWYPDPDPVTGGLNQAAGGTEEQWLTLKRDHIDALRKCMPRP